MTTARKERSLSFLLREPSVGEAIARFNGKLVLILRATLCAALGLIPQALAKGEPGSELFAPLSIVVFGGLITSTFQNLVVVPAGYPLVFGLKVTEQSSGARSLFGRLVARLTGGEKKVGVFPLPK